MFEAAVTGKGIINEVHMTQAAGEVSKVGAVVQHVYKRGLPGLDVMLLWMHLHCFYLCTTCNCSISQRPLLIHTCSKVVDSYIPRKTQ